LFGCRRIEVHDVVVVHLDEDEHVALAFLYPLEQIRVVLLVPGQLRQFVGEPEQEQEGDHAVRARGSPP